MRFWLAWVGARAKMAAAFWLIVTAGAMPAWLIDRWVLRLAPVVYLGVSLGLIWGLLGWLDFSGLVARWKTGASSTGRV